MNEQDLRPLVGASYLALAATLDCLPETAWTTPSLCEGWDVAAVVAHLTMPARYDEDQFAAHLRAVDFDFTRLSNEIAARDGKLPISALLADLRAPTLHAWTPPGGGVEGALVHVVVHGLDVTVPLRQPANADDRTLRVVLDVLVRDRVHEHFGTHIDGRELAATDLDWSYGSGARVRASARNLILELTGRRVPTAMALE
jgi:uncharacterized protein (TIGR03083 family)